MFQKVAFIGAGSMAEAMISGILAKEFLNPAQLFITNRDNKERLERLEKSYQVHCSSEKEEVVRDANVIILSMKPKDVVDAIQDIKPYITADQLIISVLAGVSTDYLSNELGENVAVVRAMPNTSAMIGFSATAISPGKFANENHVEQAVSLFQTIGTTVVVEESDLHTITGLSGSGPAYIYYFVEAMERAAQEAGLKQEVAKDLIIQTLVGAAEMLKISEDHPSVLRQKITSPGGTTQAGLETLEQYKYQEGIISCIKRATQRSIELGSPYQSSVK
ncbi:pyrroline-5-carboxylate reductase ProI [Bacillaceae bacterium S4-13-56]